MPPQPVTEQWTPGPWSVEIDDQSGIGRTHAVYICGEGGWPEGQLARVNTQDGLGEREANARLIAAAPDLYAACEASQKLIDDMSRFVGQMAIRDYALFNEAPIALAAALAKARGEVK